MSEQGQTRKSYGWEPDSPWGTKILWQADHSNTHTNAKTYHYIHSDHLGTPQIATDKSGHQTWAQVSQAFGKASISPNASTEINIRFPGQYYDKETGTHYNFHRDYDPSTGRYLQSDPIGLQGGLNMFAYVAGNPIIFYDSLGLLRATWIEYPNIKSWGWNYFETKWYDDPVNHPSEIIDKWGFFYVAKVKMSVSVIVSGTVLCEEDCNEWTVKGELGLGAMGWVNAGPNIPAAVVGGFANNFITAPLLSTLFMFDKIYVKAMEAKERLGAIAINDLILHGAENICKGNQPTWRRVDGFF